MFFYLVLCHLKANAGVALKLYQNAVKIFQFAVKPIYSCGHISGLELLQVT